MAASMRLRDSGRTISGELIVREADAVDTPAWRATSVMLTLRWLRFAAFTQGEGQSFAEVWLICAALSFTGRVSR